MEYVQNDNLTSRVTVYDATGKAHLCFAVDARERVARGWTLEPVIPALAEAVEEPKRKRK